MYEQYTDKQIVEMLVPKLMKVGLGWNWDVLIKYPKRYENMIKVIAIIYRSGYIRSQLGRSFIIGEKETKESINTFKVGDKVKFLGFSIEDEETLNDRLFYPPVNTVGKVLELGSEYCFVQWPDGATVDNGVWACRNTYLKKVVEHWVPATKDNVEVGSKVKMINKEANNIHPYWYPAIGTVGVVERLGYNDNCWVQWPEGTTSKDDKWFCNYEHLEVLLCE